MKARPLGTVKEGEGCTNRSSKKYVATVSCLARVPPIFLGASNENIAVSTA